MPDLLFFGLISAVDYANKLILDAGQSMDNYFFLSGIEHPVSSIASQ
jgi:hypothetical protein